MARVNKTVPKPILFNVTALALLTIPEMVNTSLALNTLMVLVPASVMLPDSSLPPLTLLSWIVPPVNTLIAFGITLPEPASVSEVEDFTTTELPPKALLLVTAIAPVLILVVPV